MYTFDQVGLCCGSLIQADFRGLAEAASKAGFKSISLWPTLFYGALESGLSEHDLRSILYDNDLKVTELDPLMSWLPMELEADDMAAGFLAYSEDDFYRIADTVGARSLNFIQHSTSPVTHSERIDLISAICDRADKHGLLVSVEFLPWSPINDLPTALELVKSVGKDNFGVNIDTWHHFRSGGTVHDLTCIDSDMVTAVQLNDLAKVPWDNMIEETSTGRLLPGKGCSDTVAVLQALYTSGIYAPLNVEVFSAELMGLTADQAARLIAESTSETLQAANEHAQSAG